MRWIIALLGIGLLVTLGWAGMHGDSSAAIAWLTTTPWGRATTYDLYLGFTLFGVLVWRLEDNAAKALLWWVATLVLGNIVPAAYFFMRLARMRTLAATGA